MDTKGEPMKNTFTRDMLALLTARSQSLTSPAEISWNALSAQFASVAQDTLRDMTTESLDDLRTALPHRRIDATDTGLTVHPTA